MKAQKLMDFLGDMINAHGDMDVRLILRKGNTRTDISPSLEVKECTTLSEFGDNNFHYIEIIGKANA